MARPLARPLLLVAACVVATSATPDAASSDRLRRALDALLPLDDPASYVVELHPPSLDALVSGGDSLLAQLGVDAARSVAYPMTDADGDSYTCYLPRAVAPAVAPDRLDARSLAVGAKLAVARAVLAPQLSRAAADSPGAAHASGAEAPAPPAAPPCLAKQQGFWTYLVCPGRAVRQYHVDAPRTPAPAAAAVGGSGSGSAVANTAAAPAGATLDLLLGEFTGDALEVAPRGLAYVQSFAGGTAGRATTVRFVCEPDSPALPPGVGADIVSVREPTPLAYELTVHTRDAALCIAAPSNAALLAPVNGSVLRHTEGWWTYELTVGGTIRQFHDEGGGKEAAVSVIGVYDWAAGEQLDNTTLGVAAALVQRYAGGSACGVTGNAPRRATVRVECAPDGGAATTPAAARSVAAPSAHGALAEGVVTLGLLSIREPQTCAYEITLASNAPCHHPDVQPPLAKKLAGGAFAAGAAPPATIHCFGHFELALAQAMQLLLARAAAVAGAGALSGAGGAGAGHAPLAPRSSA